MRDRSCEKGTYIERWQGTRTRTRLWESPNYGPNINAQKPRTLFPRFGCGEPCSSEQGIRSSHTRRPSCVQARLLFLRQSSSVITTTASVQFVTFVNHPAPRPPLLMAPPPSAGCRPSYFKHTIHTCNTHPFSIHTQSSARLRSTQS